MKRIDCWNKFANFNFADNWICCNQTDGTWQTPAVGKNFEKKGSEVLWDIGGGQANFPKFPTSRKKEKQKFC